MSHLDAPRVKDWDAYRANYERIFGRKKPNAEGAKKQAKGAEKQGDRR